MLSFAPTTAAARRAPLSAAPAPRRAPGGLAALQRSFGNQAVQRALRDNESPEGVDPTMLSDQDAGTDGGAQPAPPSAPPPAPAVTVTLPAHIQAASSPAGMPDRIPPRVDTPASITISGLAASAPPVTLSIAGGSANNGTATINGAATAALRASATVQLRGTAQTRPGNAGNLMLVADQGATRLAATPGFSVSAIPQNWSITGAGLVTGTERGIDVNNNWQSDSGVVADLDEASRSEQVQYGVGTGCFAGVTGSNSGYRPANSPPLVDHHAAPLSLLTGPGRILAEQTFIFIDNRTGATDIPARNSGFRLTREVAAPSPGTLTITTTKAGTATSANGFASAAGSGTVTSGAQAV